jgi:hypothetical protein
MLCPSCASGKRKQFVSEIAIHFSGLENLDKPSVFVFPTVFVCLNCGFSHFTVPDTELVLLAESAPTSQPSITEKGVDPKLFGSRDCA